MTSAETATTRGRDDAERHRRRVLGEQQPGAAAGASQRIAERPRVRLARHRVARDDADGHRQEEQERRGERGEDEEQAVVRDLRDEGGSAALRPSPADRRGRRSSRSSPPRRSRIGTPVRTASRARGAPAAERGGQFAAQQPEESTPPSPGARRALRPATSNPSPVRGDERVLQGGPLHAEAAYPYAHGDQRRVQRRQVHLRGRGFGRDPVAVRRQDRDAALLQDAARVP